MFPRSSAAPDISDSGRSSHFSGNHGILALQPPAHVCQYSTNLRLSAPGLEPACFQSAYGAATDRSAPSVGVPLRAGGSRVEFHVQVVTGERIAALEGIGEMPREAPNRGVEAGRADAEKERVGPAPATKDHEAMAPERGKGAGMDLGL